MLDEKKGIEQPIDLYLGVGYNFLGPYIDSKNKLKLSVAIGHRARESEYETVSHPILSTRLKYGTMITETVSLELVGWHKAKTEDIGEDYELVAELGVRMKISEKGSVGVKYHKNYDHIPIAGKKKRDAELTVDYKHDF